MDRRRERERASERIELGKTLSSSRADLVGLVGRSCKVMNGIVLTCLADKFQQELLLSMLKFTNKQETVSR